MTITALALTNPGAEVGDVTGWTTRAGTDPTAASTGFSGQAPHSGSRLFRPAAGASQSKFDQEVDVSAYATAIDGGVSSVMASGWHLASAGGTDYGVLYVEAYDSGHVLLDSNSSDHLTETSWTENALPLPLPSGTRFVRIGADNVRVAGSNCDSFWDDFGLTISDDTNQDYPPKASQLVAYALVSEPAEQVRADQVVPLTVSAAETSNGNYLVNVHQVVAYALVKGKVDRVDLRAWAFLQDDHLFYGLQLGSAGTIVYDILTQQWCQWYSPGFTYFRCEDVTDWEGYNLGCDTENGTIWKIDPTGRLDNGDTVITSQCTGMVTVRMRENVPCYMAELAVSEANPAASSGTSIQLRTSDDATASWLDHGTVNGEAVGTSTLFRWYGLGCMASPGRQFEITSVGYCRRIDALMIEAGGRA